MGFLTASNIAKVLNPSYWNSWKLWRLIFRYWCIYRVRIMFRYGKTEAVLRLLLRLFWKFEKILIIFRYLRAFFNKTIFRMLWHSLSKKASIFMLFIIDWQTYWEPNFKVSTPNFVKKQFSPIILGFEGSLGLLGVFDPQFIIRQPSLQPLSYKWQPKTACKWRQRLDDVGGCCRGLG